ncbi:helix-turn-helix transcriptional regulator [Agarivorans sp. QJM3NY_33]|uniref:helix-turn-helix transcriptional regulator n=1 Tax=Agarivorans sp. QJM3NY_33 TaxID=3421432 RepID=UPI003D7C80D9
MLERFYCIGQKYEDVCQILNLTPRSTLVSLGYPESQDPSNLVLTAKQFSLLFSYLMMDYGKDDIHIKLAEAFAKGTYGKAFQVFQSSKNIGEGVYRLSLFKRMIEPVNWTVYSMKDRLTLKILSNTPDYVINGVFESLNFLWLIECCRNLTGQYIVPSRVVLSTKTLRQSEVEQKLECSIEIGVCAQLDLPLDVVSVPLLSANKNIIDIVDKTIEPHSFLYGNEFQSLVQDIITDLLPSGKTTSARVAGKLSMSKRTFERRLAAQGHTFRELLVAQRKILAQQYLATTNKSIEEISIILGFNETNSFYRAFRRWQGCSPKIYRDTEKV